MLNHYVSQYLVYVTINFSLNLLLNSPNELLTISYTTSDTQARTISKFISIMINTISILRILFFIPFPIFSSIQYLIPFVILYFNLAQYFFNKSMNIFSSIWLNIILNNLDKKINTSWIVFTSLPKNFFQNRKNFSSIVIKWITSDSFFYSS